MRIAEGILVLRRQERDHKIKSYFAAQKTSSCTRIQSLGDSVSRAGKESNKYALDIVTPQDAV